MALTPREFSFTQSVDSLDSKTVCGKMGSTLATKCVSTMSDEENDRWGNDDDRRERLSRYNRRDQEDDYDDASSDWYGRAKAKVASVAMALLIVTILSLLMCIVIVGVAVFLAVVQPNNKDEDTILGIVYGIAGVLGLAYYSVLLIGTMRLKNMTSHSWAMTAAIMSIASILCLGVCSVLQLGFGIWALVVLSDSEVKRAFQMSGEGERSTDYDDY